VTEAEFQSSVVTVAHLHGWLVNHAHKGNTAGRWYTPTIDAGFPDLVLAHPARGVIFAELKAAKGVMSPAQTLWRTTLSGYVAYRLWRPVDMPQIVDELSSTVCVIR
jgi:hypothetical protein